MNTPTQEQKDLLWNICSEFVTKHRLHEDNYYDIDQWGNNSVDLVYGVMKIIGEFEYEET